MAMRRFTRLTNAFSKKIENHRAAGALHIAHYDFCRVHESIRVTPAMQLGVTDHVWSLGVGRMLCALALAATATVAAQTAELQRPTPGPTEAGQPEQHRRPDDSRNAHNVGDPTYDASEKSAAFIKATQPQIAEREPNEYGRNGHEEGSADWWMICLTSVLALAAIAQACIYYRQARPCGALDVSRMSADAATSGAAATERALHDLERPWLLVEPDGPPGVTLDPIALVDRRLANFTPDDESVVFYFPLRVTNLGRSPAWIISEGIACEYLTSKDSDERPQPPQQPVMMFSRRPLAPNELRSSGEGSILLQPEKRVAMLSGGTRILVYGMIRYRDAFGSEHETGFCWLHRRWSETVRRTEAGKWEGAATWDESRWELLEGPESYFRYT
jgi:hypothetical protein